MARPEPFALFDAEVVSTGAETDKGEEGCLSIPGIRDLVERPSTCVVEGLDREGRPVRIEAEGMLARILQHEVDHLHGIVCCDRMESRTLSTVVNYAKHWSSHTVDDVDWFFRGDDLVAPEGVGLGGGLYDPGCLWKAQRSSCCARTPRGGGRRC